VARDRLRRAVITNIASDMLKAGKVLSEFEYRKLPDASLTPREIKRVFGRWPRVLKMIEAVTPEVWEELTTEKVVEPPPKPVAPKVRKVVKKSAPKVSVKKEIEDE